MRKRIDARQHLESLVGKTIYTLSRQRPNRILRVTEDAVVVATQKSPGGMPVQLGRIQNAIDRLVRDGEIEPVLLTDAVSG